MRLALFDLDNTLLAGDSDHAWGRFLAAVGAVDGATYEAANNRFFEAYRQGTLDIGDYLAFALEPLRVTPMATLLQWRRTFLHEWIRPMIPDSARALVKQHQRAGDRLLIITATNRFVTAPIAAELGVPNLLATEPEMVAGRFTGQPLLPACFQGGKITRLEQWLGHYGLGLEGACFYSDSHNDLPLLRQVHEPVAVNPDPELTRVAIAEGWRQMQLTHQESSPLAV
ncbi:MAG: HAD-IB family hydrolase [Gammaproteobacteria bacterium]|nr:HAD-IB family hydrolase [Gammaproteobacteria bacterium]